MENTFKYRVAQVMAGEYKEYDTVPVCDTPQLIQAVGFSKKSIEIAQRHIRNCLAPEETAKSGEHHHDLPIDFMDNLPKYISEPAIILSSLTQASDSVVLVTDCKDKKDRPIIVALKNDGDGVTNGRTISCNVVTSTYGKDGFAGFLKRSLCGNGLLYWNEKKSRDMAASIGLQLPEFLTNHNSNVIIRRYNDNVNPLSQNILDFSPDGYGATLYRPDKQPFAYSDPDGRQKVYEYTKNRNGNEVLGSTTATFSDGRSEITEYNESGTVIGIERKDAQGRTTYTYSSNGLAFYAETREESREYFDGKDKYRDKHTDYSMPLYKSVHEKTRGKVVQRGIYYDECKECWTERDISGNMLRLKRNEYGTNDRVMSAHDDIYTYNDYDMMTSHISEDGSVVKTEYYSPDEVSDYYHLTPDDYDAGVRDYDKRKSEVTRQPDGRVSKKSYEICGDYTEVEFLPDGKITRFCDVNGRSYTGQAAQLEYFKSEGGKAPTFKEVAAAANALRSSAAPKTKNAGKPNGKPTGSGGNGSSGAGR